MIDEVNFKNLLIADFYIRFREEINKRGLFEKYSKEEIDDTDNFAKKKFKRWFQAPDSKEKLEQIANKVYDEVRKLDATQHIRNKKENFAEIKQRFYDKFDEKQDFSDTDFLDMIDENADGNDFFKQFAILVKKDGKISEWEKEAIYQLGTEFNLSNKEIDKYFKSNKALIIVLCLILLLGGVVYVVFQNDDISKKIYNWFVNETSQTSSEASHLISSSDVNNTISTDDYNVKFNEYEVRQKLSKETPFYIGSFSQTIDCEKEPDIFEDLKFGDRQIILPVVAEFKYLFYLDEIGEIECDENRVVRLTLPPIHLQEESCDVIWDNVIENTSWFRKNFTPEEKVRMKNAAEKYLVEVAKNNYEYKSKATEEAEQFLTDFFTELGFKVIIYKTATILFDTK